MNHRQREGWRTLALLLGLWLICMGSALALVYTTFESRRATQQLEELRIKASEGQVMSGQYLLEKSSWSAYSQMNGLAVRELQMVMPGPDNTILVHSE